MQFIDLFAGLGGFHLALDQLGLQCVFASEINPYLRALYKKNFGLEPVGDIRQIVPSEIPSHDLLCAGFPCQPFSKAGKQDGLNCPRNGNLFDEIIKVIKVRQPPHVLLENVANLKKHDRGNTWEVIRTKLEREGYTVQEKILSPHQFGIPQIRERMFIVGSKEGLSNFQWPNEYSQEVTLSFDDILESNPVDATPLPNNIITLLTTWQELLDELKNTPPPLPLWSMEFGADYPYEETTPFALGFDKLRNYRGSFGMSLNNLSESEIIKNLPSYAYMHPKAKLEHFPSWKIRFIKKNRQFYQDHKEWLDRWIPKVKTFYPSFQKFEWNCHGDQLYLWDSVIQLRASGIRVKRRSTAPSLVGVHTQIPIIAWQKRYMTAREGAKLQSMDKLKFLPETPSQTFHALGNAVNVELVKLIAKNLLYS